MGFGVPRLLQPGKKVPGLLESSWVISSGVLASAVTITHIKGLKARPVTTWRVGGHSNWLF